MIVSLTILDGTLSGPGAFLSEILLLTRHACLVLGSLDIFVSPISMGVICPILALESSMITP